MPQEDTSMGKSINLIAYTQLNPLNSNPSGNHLDYMGGESMVDLTFRIQCNLCELFPLLSYNVMIKHNLVNIENTDVSLHIVKASLKEWRKIASEQESYGELVDVLNGIKFEHNKV